MLDLLFNLLDFKPGRERLNGGNFTTDAVNYHAYPNTFLFSLIDEPGRLDLLRSRFPRIHFRSHDQTRVPLDLRFCQLDLPGYLGTRFQDVTGLSHETSEALNDPLETISCPPGNFPTRPGFAWLPSRQAICGRCFPVATVPIVIKEKNEVFQYHPQPKRCCNGLR